MAKSSSREKERPSLTARLKREVSRGMVRVSFKDGDDEAFGSGFLVGENFIVTAAHCLPRLPDPLYAGDDLVGLKIDPINGGGSGALSRLIYCDPCSDFALLTALDVQEHFDEAAKFESLTGRLESVDLSIAPLRFGAKHSVWVRSFEGIWHSGSAFVAGHHDHTLAVTLDDGDARISGGTSGAPVLDQSGTAIGVLKIGSITHGEYSAVALPDIIPLWFFNRMREIKVRT